jgi:GDP/UDP-N,N'-diacetylbacillosamine 2-epimerase (hydrolysing)
MINILSVTGSRSEYDLLYPLIKKLDNKKKISFHLLCCGSHLDRNFGNTINEIKKDKLSNVYEFKTKTIVKILKF